MNFFCKISLSLSLFLSFSLSLSLCLFHMHIHTCSHIGRIHLIQKKNWTELYQSFNITESYDFYERTGWWWWENRSGAKCICRPFIDSFCSCSMYKKMYSPFCCYCGNLLKYSMLPQVFKSSTFFKTICKQPAKGQRLRFREDQGIRWKVNWHFYHGQILRNFR